MENKNMTCVVRPKGPWKIGLGAVPLVHTNIKKKCSRSLL
jgi:hypothetical protein